MQVCTCVFSLDEICFLPTRFPNKIMNFKVILLARLNLENLDTDFDKIQLKKVIVGKLIQRKLVYIVAFQLNIKINFLIRNSLAFSDSNAPFSQVQEKIVNNVNKITRMEINVSRKFFAYFWLL